MAGRPRKYENNAAKQKAYRERGEGKALKAQWNPHELRQEINSLHTVLHFAAANLPELAPLIGATARETLKNVTEHYRRQYHDAGGNQMMKALNNL
jgi:LytS/YehU family sensor histidine kinase